MASEYDLFHTLVLKGEQTVANLAKILGKSTKERANIRKKILLLQKKKLVEMNGTIRVLDNEKSTALYRLIRFCTKNSMSYNILFREEMLNFIQHAALKEFFTIKDVGINSRTFARYVEALERFGFLLIVSRKPLKCKLLRHHFLENLGKYFRKPIKFYKPTHHSFLPQIKKEFAGYERKAELNYSVIQEIEEKQEVKFINASLSLEGNPITLSDTQKIIVDKVIPKSYDVLHVHEVTNYKKAVDLMIENARMKKKLNLQLVLRYHAVAMSHIHGAGEIRKQNVKIKGNPQFKTENFRLLPGRLGTLFKEYDTFEKKRKDVGEVIKFASYFHNEFQRIHPFIDGNSRTSRLLMLHILRSYNIPILTLPLGYFDLYMNLTKRSQERDDESFRYLIEEVVFFNLKRMNNLLLEV